ncbi:MAG: aminopeptidase P family protein [Clostridiales bacterium]|nr:aminopeptidase P family protein [Clostridiales bacterium]
MNGHRLSRVRENMAAEGLRCVVVSDPTSIYYLTGVVIDPGERMLALAIDGDRTALFANRLFALSGKGLPLVEFGDTDDSVACLADWLPGGDVGVDKAWPSGFLMRLMARRPDIRPVQGLGPVDGARMIKDAGELDALRESSRRNDCAMSELISALRPGMTELEACEVYRRAAAGLGAEGMAFEPLICFGANAAEPHHIPDGTPLQSGDAAILDVGLRYRGALSDMTRTVVFGKASGQLRALYELVRAANAAGAAAARPGVRLSDVDGAARGVIAAAGYGEQFIHRTGHGLGLQVHEPPDVSATSTVVARPGMVFSIEPGIYLPGQFGVRIEDLVAVIDGGCEVLNRLPRELIEI